MSQTANELRARHFIPGRASPTPTPASPWTWHLGTVQLACGRGQGGADERAGEEK